MALQWLFGLFGQHTWSLLASVFLAYVVAICIYRRFFHPLAKVPGPFLPAVTMLYQSYYNKYYYLQIEKMHARYGTIVRITPDEVSLADPEDYEKIYHVGTRFYKAPNYYNALCVPHSSFGSIANATHRIRRGATNPMFSRPKVLELERIVQEKAHKVCRRLQEGIDKDQPVDLHHAFRAVSIDVISDYAFDRCYNYLDQVDFGEQFFLMSAGIGPALWVFQQLPFFQKIALATPPWMAPYLSRPLGHVTEMQMECVRQVEGVKEKIRTGKSLGRETIFTMLLSPEDKPEGYVVPTTWQLKDEAYGILAAASETTGSAMTMAFFHIVNNPDVYAKLAKELKDKFPDPMAELPYLELEKLPYLTAVIKESLRHSYGIVARLVRSVPGPAPVQFQDHTIPAGYNVSMSAWLMHRNPSSFPNPEKFDPDRFLGSPEKVRQAERYLVPFSRGSRQCVGMNLAYCELYVMIGTLFRRHPKGLRVWDTPYSLMNDFEDYFNINMPLARRKEWVQAYMEKQ